MPNGTCAGYYGWANAVTVGDNYTSTTIGAYGWIGVSTGTIAKHGTTTPLYGWGPTSAVGSNHTGAVYSKFGWAQLSYGTTYHGSGGCWWGFAFAGGTGNTYHGTTYGNQGWAANFVTGYKVPNGASPIFGFSSVTTGARNYYNTITIPSGDQDRFRFVIEDNVGNILSRDLEVSKPVVMRALSGPANITFDIDYRNPNNAAIPFKPWGTWVHAEKMIYGQYKIWCSCLVQPGQIDKKTGVLHLQAKGFSAYPKGMPWLENWNPLAIDPFEVVAKIWKHLEHYSNGKLGVSVYPAISGLEMLPGYAFDGNIMNLNFFAEYIRASDKQDCGNVIDKLAMDIPFDYVEQSAWNYNQTAITKGIFLGYPKAGVQQDALSFIINENVIEALPHVETEIDWVSDVIIDGWFPGTEYSATFINPDTSRYRRTISQDDARINSDEMAAAWARRKLAKRQTPPYWESIVVEMGHPNAPFGTYDVGDRIWVTGYMPWVGDVKVLQKILAIQVNEEDGTAEITMYAEGAFNYDPIYYPGKSGNTRHAKPSKTPNIIHSLEQAILGIL